jgi:hypothetical protein
MGMKRKEKIQSWTFDDAVFFFFFFFFWNFAPVQSFDSIHSSIIYFIN